MTIERTWREPAIKLMLIIMAVQIPVFALAAWLFGTSVWTVVFLSVLIVSGPAAAYAGSGASRFTSMIIATASMGLSALLIHLSHGMIEMHFHIFATIALLVMLGDWRANLTAAVITAVHHILFWAFLPGSLFNYQAGFEIVLLHALFVVVETIPVCLIALKYERACNAEQITSARLPSTAQSVAISTGKIANLSAMLNTSVHHQRVSAEETSVSISQIGAVARVNSEQAARAEELSRRLFGEALPQTESYTSKMMQRMNAVVEYSHKIAEVVRAIDAIAFQTNILALNASVEAARAGESGASFGVVAQEVRTLAHRCASAAEDTRVLLEGSNSNSAEAAAGMHDVQQQIKNIVQQGDQLLILFQDIRRGSLDQSEAILQIGEAQLQANNAAEEIVRVAQESADAGAELSQQTQELGAMVAALQ